MRVSLCLLLMLPLAAACEEKTSPGPTDAGEVFFDTGVRDAGEPCDPIAKTGCTGAEVCTLDSNLGVSCRPVGTQALGETCDVAARCVDGLSCRAVLGEPQRCIAICRPGTDADCADRDPDLRCGPVLEGTNYALCGEFEDECVPFDDECPVGEVCALTSGTTAGCLPVGTATVGEACGGSLGSCARGGLCVALGGGAPTCYEPCEPAQAGADCPGDLARCVRLRSGSVELSFGVCQTLTACTPVNDTCVDGQSCQLLGPDAACAPVGEVLANGDCTTGACVRGQLCLRLTIGEMDLGQRCFKPCTTMADCGGKNCVQITDQDFGVCDPR